LVNDGRGSFRDESEHLAPGLRNCGMVRSAQWSDLDGDQKPELIVAGEFMPISIWKQKNGRLVAEQIKGSEGFWNTLAAGDLDGDGDLDFVAGNLGLNHKYNISPTTPLQLFGADYDQNGNYEAILTYYLDGQQTPLHGREDLLRQIPALRKTFTDYASYANAKWQDILPAPLLKKADQKQIVCSTSAWFENRGKDGFVLHPLPRAAQTAPINAILLEDLNGDQRLDILAVGNQYDWEISSGRMDAGMGWVLVNQGRGQFKSLPTAQTGFGFTGEGRGLVKVGSGPLRLLGARNDESLILLDRGQ
jgi:enediyne biosynthesis protein E4